MDLFPIGTMADGSDNGTIDSVSYSFFEPNVRATSSPKFTSLVSRFQNQTILARKKADPYLTLNYEYNNIYASEYQQIEHFIDSKEDAVNSFYVVDLSKGTLPTAINTSSTWTASIANTRLYDTVTNQKANYMLFYNGVTWKLGTVTTVNANVSVVCNVDTNNYGAMTDAEGAIITEPIMTMVYPVYQCFTPPGSLESFKTTVYWSNEDENRGFLYSGNLSFVTKYKI
jgi:hypothetical protein